MGECTRPGFLMSAMRETPWASSVLWRTDHLSFLLTWLSTWQWKKCLGSWRAKTKAPLALLISWQHCCKNCTLTLQPHCSWHATILGDCSWPFWINSLSPLALIESVYVTDWIFSSKNWWKETLSRLSFALPSSGSFNRLWSVASVVWIAKWYLAFLLFRLSSNCCWRPRSSLIS